MIKREFKNILFLLLSVIISVALYSIIFERGELFATINPDPMEGYYPSLMPHYPSALEFPLGYDMKVGEADFKMSYFVIEDPLEQIANFYSQYWKELGLYVYRDINLKYGIVSTYDPVSKNIASVTMMREGNITLVFPSLINAGQRKLIFEWPSYIEDKVAIYPGSERGFFFSSNDPEFTNYSLVYFNKKGLEKNLSFIKKRMKELGWNLNSSDKVNEIPDTLSLFYTKNNGRELCIVNISGFYDKVYVYINCEEGR